MVEEGAENFDETGNFPRGADVVQQSVMPAKAGIQVPFGLFNGKNLDSRLHGNDEIGR